MGEILLSRQAGKGGRAGVKTTRPVSGRTRFVQVRLPKPVG